MVSLQHLLSKHTTNISNDTTNIRTIFIVTYKSNYNTFDVEDFRVCSLQLEEWWLLELIQNKDPISAKYYTITVHIYLTGYDKQKVYVINNV
jgi:hypothetical protein